jgi:hypothetical protein
MRNGDTPATPEWLLPATLKLNKNQSLYRQKLRGTCYFGVFFVPESLSHKSSNAQRDTKKNTIKRKPKYIRRDKMCIEKGNQQNIQPQPGLNYFYSAFSINIRPLGGLLFPANVIFCHKGTKTQR